MHVRSLPSLHDRFPGDLQLVIVSDFDGEVCFNRVPRLLAVLVLRKYCLGRHLLQRETITDLTATFVGTKVMPTSLMLSCVIIFFGCY